MLRTSKGIQKVVSFCLSFSTKAVLNSKKQTNTFPKFNSEFSPESSPPTSIVHVQGLCSNFGGVVCIFKCKSQYIWYIMILNTDRVPSLYRLISYCNLSQPTHRWLSLMRECSARHNESECLGGEQIGEFSTWETLKMMFWFTVHVNLKVDWWFMVRWFY